MPIQIKCACGKALRVKDELAGKKVRCPGCGEILVARAPLDEHDGEAVVPVLRAPPSRKTPPKPIFDDSEDDDAQTAVTEKPPRKAALKARAVVDDDGEEDDRRPAKSGKRRDRDEDDDEDDRRSIRVKKRRATPDVPLPTSSGGIPSGIGVGVGMMIAGVVLFVGPLVVGYFVPYSLILFIIGIVAVVKGALGK